MRFLRKFLPVLVCVAAVLGLVAAATRTSEVLIDEAERMRFADRLSLLKNRSDTVGGIMHQAVGAIGTLATAPFEVAPGSVVDKAILDKTIESSFGRLAGAALLDAEGNVVAHSGDGSAIPPPTDPGFADLRERLDAGLLGLTQVMWRGDGVPTVGYAGEILAPTGRRGTAVVFALITGSSGYQTLVDAASVVGEDDAAVSAFLLFDRNRVLVGGREETELGKQLPPLDVYVDAAAAGTGHAEFTEGGVRKVIIHQPVPGTGYTIAFLQDAASFYGRIRAQHRLGNLLLFGLLGVFGVIALVLWNRKHQLIRRNEEQLGAMLGNAADAVVVVKGGHVAYGSPAIERLTGIAPADLVERPVPSFLGDNTEAFDDLVTAATTEPGEPVTGDLAIAHADGTTRWAAVTVVDLVDNATIGGLVVTLHDVTERKELEAKVAHRALHDPLTDLANRVLFQDRLQLATDRVARHPSTIALLYIDLDKFKPVNDELGHHAGDVVLMAIAGRLRNSVRAHDTAARLGGDEFAVLLENLEHPRQAEELARRLLAAIARPIDVDGRPVAVGASIGVAVAEGGAVDPEALMRNADLAMYEAKDSGDGIVVFGRQATGIVEAGRVAG